MRKRLDFERPVPRELFTDCVRVALQVPSGSNRWLMQFVIVTEREQREALAGVYRAAYEQYLSTAAEPGPPGEGRKWTPRGR